MSASVTNILAIAERIRAGFEAEGGPFDDMCRTMSGRLHQALAEAGFFPRLVPGQYVGMDEDYAPDTSEWEEEDIDAYDGDPGMAHWWVVCEGMIVDICADQFHPSDRDAWRIVVTEEEDPDYAALFGMDMESFPSP